MNSKRERNGTDVIKQVDKCQWQKAGGRYRGIESNSLNFVICLKFFMMSEKNKDSE